MVHNEVPKTVEKVVIKEFPVEKVVRSLMRVTRKSTLMRVTRKSTRREGDGEGGDQGGPCREGRGEDGHEEHGREQP